ncbi:hypothetical protein FRB95_014601 [Tulasnella sp. JGI-2019a]|nr:hypothetical protein FRB95_014601 [Tulasnella sp. JGI-2019a]
MSSSTSAFVPQPNMETPALAEPDPESKRTTTAHQSRTVGAKSHGPSEPTLPADIALDVWRGHPYGETSTFDLILHLCRLFGLTLLIDLAYRLRSLFENTESLNALSQGIRFHQDATNPETHGHASTTTSSPTTSSSDLRLRHDQGGDSTDTERSSKTLVPAESSSETDSEPRTASPFNVVPNTSTLSKKAEDGSKLDQSIKDHQEALELLSEEHSSRAMTLSSLAYDLSVRFEQTGDRSDLDQSIECGLEALTLWPEGDQGKATLLSNLSASLGKRYEQTHDVGDLEMRMMFLEDMRDPQPEERPDEPTSISDLPGLDTQSEQARDIDDIEKTMDALAADSETRAGELSDLALALWTQFEGTGDQSDLAQSIKYGEEALRLWPEGHPFRVTTLSNLAVGLSRRFELNGDGSDLDRSIEYGEEAVQLWPEGDFARATPLSNLAVGLCTRSRQTGNKDDLDQSIEYLQEVLALQPEDDLSRDVTQTNLAVAIGLWRERYCGQSRRF